MSQRKKNNPGKFVPLDLCLSKHEALTKEMTTMTTELKTIKEALVGPDLQGGLVKKIVDMNSKLKGSWTGRDKALLGVAIVEGIVAIIIAITK